MVRIWAKNPSPLSADIIYVWHLTCVWRAFFGAGQAVGASGADGLTIAGHRANHVALGVGHVLAVGRVRAHVDAVAETIGEIDGDDGALACSLLIAVAAATWKKKPLMRFDWLFTRRLWWSDTWVGWT